MNNGRQAVLEAAHFKMQQKMMEMHQKAMDWQMQKVNDQESAQPLTKIENAYNAPAIAPGIQEAYKFSRDPKNYLYQPPAKPQTVTAPPMLPDDAPAENPDPESFRPLIQASINREQQLTPPPPIAGRRGYEAMVQDTTQAGADLELDRKSRELEMAIKKGLATYGGKQEFDKQNKSVIAGKVQSVVGPMKTDQEIRTAEGKVPSQVAAAKGIAEATAPIKTQTAIDIANAKATTPNKALDRTSRSSLLSRQEYIDKVDSIVAAMQKGEYPITGTGPAFLNNTAEKAGGLFGLTLNDPRMSAAHKLIDSLLLDLEKQMGGARMVASPYMLARAKTIYASADNSPGGVLARLKQASVLAKEAQTAELESTKTDSHMDVTSIEGTKPRAYSIEELLGGAPGGRQGVWRLPGMPEPFQSFNQGPPENSGVTMAPRYRKIEEAFPSARPAFQQP
jgi:hypothetical protein